MTCPKCGNENVNVQIVTETKLKNKHHGVLWWLCIGWWWIPIKWLFFFWIALIVKIFSPKRQKITTKHITKCVCQTCGNTWNA